MRTRGRGTFKALKKIQKTVIQNFHVILRDLTLPLQSHSLSVDGKMNHMAGENPVMSEQGVKNEQIIKLSLKFDNAGSSSDSQEKKIFTTKSQFK